MSDPEPTEGNPQEDPKPEEWVTPPADPEAEPEEEGEPQENAEHGRNEPGDEFGEGDAVN